MPAIKHIFDPVHSNGEFMERYLLSSQEAVLVIIDIQERLAGAVLKGDSVINNCSRLVELAKLFNIPIIVTEQYPKGLGRTVGELTTVLPIFNPILKSNFSCCMESGFMDALDPLSRKSVILTGMETHICVLQTCVDLLIKGYHVHVVSDAVSSRTEDNWRSGIEYMRDAGAAICGTETVLFQVLKAAGSDEFKTISKLIK